MRRLDNNLYPVLFSFPYRLEYEVRNKKKEKKEKAAYEAYMMAKAKGSTEIDPVTVE